MQSMTYLSPEWKQWLELNIARGCTTQSLIEKMVEGGFEGEFAKQTVAGMAKVPVPQPRVLVPQILNNKDPYRYDSVRLPQKGNLIRTGDRDVPISFRLAQPVVAVFDDLLSPEECDELIRLSNTKLKRSTIVDKATGQEDVIQERTSSGTFFHVNENDFIARLDRRIAEAMHWPIENGEGLQILHYQVGGEYKPHYDYFPPEDPGSQSHIEKAGQRVSTLVIYLNNVENGGETIFPRVGLSVVPKKGSAVYFEYCDGDGRLDPLTLHGGNPVVSGEKWIATKWMRQRRYN